MSSTTKTNSEWTVWKDREHQPADAVFGWWVGTRDDSLWIEHVSVAQTLADMHNKALAAAQAELRQHWEYLAEIDEVQEFEEWKEKQP